MKIEVKNRKLQTMELEYIPRTLIDVRIRPLELSVL
jgi:hypothetical protein